MNKAFLLPALLLASAVALSAQTSDSASASATTQIMVTPQSAQKVIVGTPDHFTGSARVQSLFDAKAPSHNTGGIVTFQPGARSVWHTHPIGQVLIVIEGQGWVQAWGSPVQVIRKGDVIWIPAGVKHWHGASPTCGWGNRRQSFPAVRRNASSLRRSCSALGVAIRSTSSMSRPRGCIRLMSEDCSSSCKRWWTQGTRLSSLSMIWMSFARATG